MDNIKPYNLLKALPHKLNAFYKKKSSSGLIVKNKSKSIKKFDPVTNFDKAFEKYIRKIIIKEFPKDSIIGEEFKDKESLNDFKWTIDPIDGTKAFVAGQPTWSNLVGIAFKEKSMLGLANFPALKKFYINDKKKSYVYKNGKKSILNSSNNKNLKSVRVIGSFHGILSTEKQKKIIDKFNWTFNFVSFDALNYCLLAEGICMIGLRW